ncbi:MAG: nitroreductase family protein [Spirochaetota bacterium]|nr:nitroreductase family protein [Spirochaetota bacterium]
MSLLDLLSTRRSIRKFKNTPIPDELILDILNAAILAPSASNSQPWRFLIVKDKDVINNMYQAVQKEIMSLASEIPSNTKENFYEYTNFFFRFAEAPLIIIPIYKVVDILSASIEEYFSEHRLTDIHFMERQSALISISLAIQNLLLYIHEINMGATCMTGPLIANSELKKILSVPDKWQITMLIPVGYPDEFPSPKTRKPVDRIVKWI